MSVRCLLRSRANLATRMLSVVFLFGLFATAFGSPNTTYTYEYLPGGVDDRYLSVNSTASSTSECEKSICESSKQCLIAFSDSMKLCFRVTFPAQLLRWFLEKLLIEDSEKILVYRDRPNTFLEKKPAILWLYDQISKGRNLGSAGSALDIPVTSNKWKKEAKGPRPGSPLLYVEGWVGESVALPRNGHTLLDSKSEFTISMWVKTFSYRRHMALMGSSGSFSFDFRPSSWASQVALVLGAQIAYTINNNTDVEDWRHIAVSYTAQQDPVFYLQGHVWTLEKGFSNRTLQHKTATHIKMWDIGYGDILYGRLACVAVFEDALTGSDIQKLKDNCP